MFVHFNVRYRIAHEHANERYEDCKMRDIYREIYSGKPDIIFIINHDTRKMRDVYREIYSGKPDIIFIINHNTTTLTTRLLD